ncbi:MAG TPA: hypothetical protein VE093_41920 [Polyangiaceae bacterium]|jgi:hypothetical protein|nr:hypothetical protein [Polyangiaceae bacterium]
MKRKTLIAVVGAVAAVALTAGIVMIARIGPRNVIGMMRYDQRQEGRLSVGDAAPDVELFGLDGSRREALKAHFGGQPAVLIFGSFT